MKSLDNLFDEVVHSHTLENSGLVTFFIENLVKFILFRATILLLLVVIVYSYLSIVYHLKRVTFTDSTLRFIW